VEERPRPETEQAKSTAAVSEGIAVPYASWISKGCHKGPQPFWIKPCKSEALGGFLAVAPVEISFSSLDLFRVV